MPPDRGNLVEVSRPITPAIVLAVIFVVHAATYGHFFVDDEAITLVYARNLLEGQGLRYSMLEGPVEGYSNFLHVWIMAAVLALVRAAGAEIVWVFAAGKLLSIACGAAIVALTVRLAQRLGLPAFAAWSGGLVVALAGPLAVWSNSTLETVPFALALLLLIDTTLPRVDRPLAVAAAAIAVMLMRIDGLLYAGVWLAARFVAADAGTRRVLWSRVAPAVGVAALAYHAWRVWYFGAVLPLPLQTKVLHKILGNEASVIIEAPSAYLADLLRQSGLPIALGGAAAAAGVLLRSPLRRIAVAAGLTLAVLAAYIGLVGDWMFGFRFAVALVAPFALAVAVGLAALAPRARWAAWAAAVVVAGWSVQGAWAFTAHYRDAAHRPTFWAAPRFDPALLFGEYHEICEELRRHVRPGAVIAYHEAGLIPFLLDVENIDMLGLTSRIIGAMPTGDAVHTDVGRYYPLTHRPAYNAVHAYLVWREPQFIVVRRSWMATANGGRVPESILNGHYTAAAGTPRFAVYRRSSQPLNALRTRRTGFLENLAHPAYAERISINGLRQRLETAQEQLRFLWQGGGDDILAAPAWHLHIDTRGEERVHEVLFEATAPAEALTIRITLSGAGAARTWRRDFDAPAGQPIRIWETSADPIPTDRMDIQVVSPAGTPVRLHLAALRVMGQTDRLRRHLERERLPR